MTIASRETQALMFSFKYAKGCDHKPLQYKGNHSTEINGIYFSIISLQAKVIRICQSMNNVSVVKNIMPKLSSNALS